MSRSLITVKGLNKEASLAKWEKKIAKLRKMRLGEKKKYSLYSNPRIKATISFRCSAIFFFPQGELSWNIFRSRTRYDCKLITISVFVFLRESIHHR